MTSPDFERQGQTVTVDLVRFGRADRFAGSTPPTAPNPLWHLFKYM